MVRQKQGPAADAPRSFKKLPRECFWGCFLYVFEVRLGRTEADTPSCAAPLCRLAYTVRGPARRGDTGASATFAASADVFFRAAAGLWLGYGWGYGWAMAGLWLGLRLGYGWAMAGLWLGYDWAMAGLWLGLWLGPWLGHGLGYGRAIAGLWLGYGWGYGWTMAGLWLGYGRAMPGLCLGYFWAMAGLAGLWLPMAGLWLGL
jgi:hypothetical protein